jgi:hypothetical protein
MKNNNSNNKQVSKEVDELITNEFMRAINLDKININELGEMIVNGANINK